MRKALLSLLLVGLLALPALAQCGPRDCPSRQPKTRVDVSVRDRIKVKVQSPRPAWRYERPVGHRAAVVRIQCYDDTRYGRVVWSKGSGVLVRWGKRVVVLTARHVLKDARRVYILLRGKWHRVKVLKVDKHWDCAVLDVGSLPAGIEPAEIAFGEAALQREGDRLESCGYGPDGKLAVNSGLFIGYRRSTRTAGGPDDWMVLSGYARGGDSGGPVFNEKGRVVGVLWGTDGKTVVGVQAGRLHVLLSEAVPQVAEQKVFVQLAAFQRRPTPPMPGPRPYIEPRGPLVPVDLGAEQAKIGQKPMLPWRGKAEDRDKAQAEQIDKLIELARLRAGNGACRPPSVIVQPPASTVQPPEPATDRSPLLAGLCIFGGVVCGFVIYFANQKGE